MGIGETTLGILLPFTRLLELLDEPEAIQTLTPFIQREIHYRLLASDQAAKLRQIASVDGQGYRIARAIDWLKLNYIAPLRVEELAARVQMSAPSFHQHFRQPTEMSPLQFQKWLRLSEDKRLMLSEHLDASTLRSEWVTRVHPSLAASTAEHLAVHTKGTSSHCAVEPIGRE